MEYFQKPRTFTATLRKTDAKNKKAKQSETAGGGDAPTRLVVIMTCDAAITTAMRSTMSKPVQAWVESNTAKDAAGEILEKALPLKAKPFHALIKIFDDDKKPIPLTPNESDSRVSAQVSIKKYFIIEGQPFLQFQLVMLFDNALWAWIGQHLKHEENEFSVELKPLQKSLAFPSKDANEDEE